MLVNAETKICTKCKNEKLLEEFYPNKQTKNGLSSWCKTCHNIITKEHCQKYPWKVTLNNIKTRCNNKKCERYKDYGGRGIKCLITREEIKILWFRDKAFEMTQPSIDRKENDGNYEFSNCRFIELIENKIKDSCKVIHQYDLNGKFIKTWKSQSDIERALGFAQGNISQVCLGKIKTAYKFIWRFV